MLELLKKKSIKTEELLTASARREPRGRRENKK